MRTLLRSLLTCFEKNITQICKNCGKSKMIISKEQQAAFEKATNCWICGDKLVTEKSHQDYEKNHPVRDHCHFAGKYRGPTQNECNRQFKKPKFTPKFFHNLSGYDSHL